MRHRVEVEHRGTNATIVSGSTWVGDRLCLSVDRLVAVVSHALDSEDVRGDATVPDGAAAR
jgi:hypothetical protein